jgi:hypothetical protein
MSVSLAALPASWRPERTASPVCSWVKGIGQVDIHGRWVECANHYQTLAHVHYSGYTLSQLKLLIKTLFECYQYPRKHHNAVY